MVILFSLIKVLATYFKPVPAPKLPLIKATGRDDDAAWRLAMIVPGLLMLATAIASFCLSDDCPKGNFMASYNGPNTKP